jgi:hypothetical protein
MKEIRECPESRASFVVEMKKSMNRPAIPHGGGIACRDDQMKGEKNDKPQNRNT